ncbi:hypothetical protein ArsFIN_22490 [Arsenophonus nasoniae]|uniref:Uncharacterized protein n=1 Tax=Arsenophonus nasoniae TaxID=638 RepID=A0A4P7KUN5_9GAMM|nr:hypothetical protein ArsFIN_22490 [Arsenophonus nasoniae]
MPIDKKDVELVAQELQNRFNEFKEKMINVLKPLKRRRVSYRKMLKH